MPAHAIAPAQRPIGPISVGVVDDHPLVGEGLRALLEARGAGIEVVHVASTADELIEAAGEDMPEAVLLDIRLADSSSPMQNTKRLSARGARVLIYTQGDQHEEILRALQNGALGVVHKQDPVEELIEAVETIVQNEFRMSSDGVGRQQPRQHVSARLAQALEVLVNRSSQVKLTERELEVVRLYASGLPGRAVAQMMHLSEATVKTYLRRAKDKLIEEGYEASSKHDIRTAAVKLGIIPPIMR